MTVLLVLLFVAAVLALLWYRDNRLGSGNPPAPIATRQTRRRVTQVTDAPPITPTSPPRTHRPWPGQSAEGPRRARTARTRVAGDRVVSGTRFTPPDAICSACGVTFEHCQRPTACLGRTPNPRSAT